MLPFKYHVGEKLLDVKARDQESDAVVLTLFTGKHSQEGDLSKTIQIYRILDR